MAAYRIAYAALFVAALAFSQIYAGHLSSVVFITVAVLPFASLFMVIIQRFALKLYFDCKAVTVERGTQLKLQLTAQNRFFFPCSTLYVTASMPDVEEHREAKLIFSLGAFENKQLNFVYPSKFRGEYVVSINKAYIFDILKLFKFTKTFNYQKSILVVPKIYDVYSGEEYKNVTEQETEIQTNQISGGERSFVRKYKDGDEVRKIHWKLSSKQEDYMVWQSARSALQTAVVFCDVREYSDNSAENAFNSDISIEAGIAACLFGIKQGKNCVLGYYDKELGDTAFNSANSLNDIYSLSQAAALIKSYSGDPQLSYEIKKLYGQNEQYPQTVIITCDCSENMVNTAKSASEYSDVSFIIIGAPEKSVIDSLTSLRRIKFSVINPNNFSEDIFYAVKQVL